MKKLTVVFALVGVILLTSCSSGGWSCQKSYVKTQKKEKIDTQKEV